MKNRKIYHRWILNNLFSDIGISSKDKELRRSRTVRDVIMFCLILLSVFMYWLCFVSTSAPDFVKFLMFFMYLIPIEVATVMYGWGGGIMCFTTVFIATVLISPSYAYFPFYHLVAVYIFSRMKREKSCSNMVRSLAGGLLSGLFMSAVYYLVFVLITTETFSGGDSSVVVYRLIVIVPQSILMCLFLYWFDNRCTEGLRLKFGCINEGFEEFVRRFEGNLRKGYRSMSGRIFALLLTEAVIMGIAAAFFANSLIPKMLDDYHKRVENVGAETSGTGSEGKFKPDFKPTFKPDEFSEAFESARINDREHKFSFDERGVAFDLKLILMLLCVVHPIVLLCNYAGQKLIALPITDIANVVSEFGEDENGRRMVLQKLSDLDIHSEDEIELLYRMIHRMIGELNTYIEEMKREQQLKEDLRVAKAASEAKSNFLSNMSHEIRTPINAVIGLDEMILRESDDENIRKYAFDIKNSGRTLLALINDLLDFSKIEAGKMEIIPAEYELSSVINDLINMVSEKAAEKGLKLEVDVTNDTPHLLIGDEIRIKQCILNILNNAVKYTHEGSVRLEVTSRPVSEDSIALGIRVTDTGIGIREEDLSKLTSPFERIEESRNRNIEGTGLGMSIVTQLLDMMGSRLNVSSVYGEGSDFSFEVVQQVADHEPIGDFNETYLRSINSTQRYRASFNAPDARILVVDDTPMNLNVIKGLLKPLLLTVDTAGSGLECIEKVRDNAYDIIFMDQRMPEMDGTQTLREMQKLKADENKNADTPVVMLTANVVAGIREKYIAEGFADYLSKPVDAVKLEKMIEKMLPPQKVLPPTDEAAGDDTAYDGEFLSELGAIEGIDARAALSNCMTEDILKNAVHDFCVAAKTGPERIEELLTQGDIRGYTVAVHALKSSARLIGALHLSEEAAKLEAMGDAGDREGIDAANDEMLSLYRVLYDKLKPLYEDDEAADEREIIDAAQLAEAYTGIREAAEAFDFDTADEIVKMLGNYRIPDDEKDRYTRICDLVTGLDRDSLMEEL
ncbi:MAG: response regulator [Lachnospiraceae bacterium]|nr:response regulator [Lachnospiraceae bacterium]